ncbi:uncharacterized protein [Palaemon carinicauda]|uniref:uncharacterized protein n=1 Tax=Palaemon carinicauda TaxID=392227 RepID=UPI0035B5B2B9
MAQSPKTSYGTVKIDERWRKKVLKYGNKCNEEKLDWGSHPLSVKLPFVTETLTVNNRKPDGFNVYDTGTPQRITDWKRPLRIATWNVRTLYKTGDAKVLEHELDKYKIDIAALIAQIRLKAKWFNITILCLHALTEITDDDEKDEWYDHVQAEIDQIPRYDVLLILGDMNAKIGKEVNAFQGSIGLHSLHQESNDDWIRLATFARQNSMVIGGLSEVQIVTDHMLVVGKLRVKSKSKRLTTIKNIKPNIEKLEETGVRNAYAINVQNRFGLLEEEEITSD